MLGDDAQLAGNREFSDEERLTRIRRAWPLVLRVWLEMADGTTQRIFGRTVPVVVKDETLFVDAGRFGWNRGSTAADARDRLGEAVFSVTEFRRQVSTDCGPQWWWRRPGEPVVDWELRMAGVLVDDRLAVPDASAGHHDSVRVTEWDREARALAHPRLVGREADFAVAVCVRWIQVEPDRSRAAREIVWGRILEIAIDPGSVTKVDSSPDVQGVPR